MIERTISELQEKIKVGILIEDDKFLYSSIDFQKIFFWKKLKKTLRCENRNKKKIWFLKSFGNTFFKMVHKFN